MIIIFFSPFCPEHDPKKLTIMMDLKELSNFISHVENPKNHQEPKEDLFCHFCLQSFGRKEDRLRKHYCYHYKDLPFAVPYSHVQRNSDVWNGLHNISCLDAFNIAKNLKISLPGIYPAFCLSTRAKAGLHRWKPKLEEVGNIAGEFFLHTLLTQKIEAGTYILEYNL